MSFRLFFLIVSLNILACLCQSSINKPTPMVERTQKMDQSGRQFLGSIMLRLLTRYWSSCIMYLVLPICTDKTSISRNSMKCWCVDKMSCDCVDQENILSADTEVQRNYSCKVDSGLGNHQELRHSEDTKLCPAGVRACKDARRHSLECWCGIQDECLCACLDDEKRKIL